MSSNMRGNICGNKEALVAYLYGECDAAERDALDAHLLTCLTCATELRGLRGVRTSLAEWEVPEVELGFRITQEPARRAWRWPVPVWAQAAAAALLVVSGAAALANLEVRYGPEGLVVRTGWTRSDATPSIGAMSATLPPSANAQPPEWRTELAATAEQLRREFSARAATSAEPGRIVPVRSTSSADAEQIRRVASALIEDSERRQQRELALRIQQLARDVETNRRTDLARIEYHFGKMEGQTGAAIAQQRDYMNYLVRTSQRQPQ